MKVIFVSDITNFEGTDILQEALEVTNIRDSTVVWSRQIRPTKADRNIWKKYRGRLCINKNNLLTTLGRWRMPPHQLWTFMKRFTTKIKRHWRKQILKMG